MDIAVLDHGFQRLREASAGGESVADKFRDWLVASDPVERLRINPYAVADATNQPAEALIALAFHGVAEGLLDLHWLVHCPHCNMITDETENFFELTHGSDCKMCEVDFDVDALTRIEVTFSLNRSIEDVDATAFCLPPPVLEPKVNIAGPPGQTFSGSDRIDEPGTYRYFCPITLAKGLLEVAGEPTDQVQEFHVQQLPSFNYAETAFTARPGPVCFELVNNCDKVSGIFIVSDILPDELPLESLPPRLSGLEAIHYPEYRALFGDQALAETEHLQVSAVTLLFTDIAGSTEMYETIGNAAAYGAVRAHFDLLFKEIEANGGMIVKTIGDAVMASFRDNDAALNCALAAQRAFRALGQEADETRGIRVKLGLHRGPVILVNLNGRIDYFGSSVNRAARIQDSANPDELVFSAEVRKDSLVAESLWRDSVREPQASQIALKGINTMQTVYRVTPAASPDLSPPSGLLARLWRR